MTDEKAMRFDYPYNLLTAIKGDSPLKLPQTVTPDILAGLRYALSTLPSTEQELLHLHYAEGFSYALISKRLSIPTDLLECRERKAFQKLRETSRWNYIQYGVAGCISQEASNHYNQGYHAGYSDGYHEGFTHNRYQELAPPLTKDVLNQPISFLNLSARAYNCLDRAGYTTIREIVNLKNDQIQYMRGLGRRSMDEIARSLKSLKIPHTAWYQFLL